MPIEIKVPKSAKESARKGLEERKINKAAAKPIDKPLLASAKAQAELRSHKEIERLLEEAAGQKLPVPSRVAQEKLEIYAGKYISERLEEVEVGIVDGQLSLKRFGNNSQMVARNERVFDLAADTFTFQVKNGQTEMVQSTGNFRERVYTRKTTRINTMPISSVKGGDWVLDS